MKEVLEQLMVGDALTYKEAYGVMKGIGNGTYSPEHITAFITHYWRKPVSTEELTGFRNALLDLAVTVELDTSKAIDLCGTGGDGKNTFNISTLTAVVVAGAGYKVAKHGNYGVTSVSGSSNVLEGLGYRFTSNSQELSHQLDSCNLTFLHAPLFHPALKEVGAIRKALGIKTFFNMLGPLVNPSKPAFQMVGVYNLHVARQYQYLLQQSNTKFTIVHSLDGYDEVTLTDDTRVISDEFDGILTYSQLLAKRRIEPSEIYGGGTVQESVDIFKRILAGKGTEAQNATVLANAALALKTITPAKELEDCYAEVRESLVSGIALKNLNTLING